MLGLSTQKKELPSILTRQCGEQLGARSQANIRVAASSASKWATKDCKKKKYKKPSTKEANPLVIALFPPTGTTTSWGTGSDSAMLNST